MRTGDDVDTPHSIYLNCDGDMERNGDDDDQEDDEGQDVKQEEEDEEQNDDKEEDDDEDEDDLKELRTIIQGEMVNTAANHGDTMLDNQPIVLPEQVKEMWEHTPHA